MGLWGTQPPASAAARAAQRSEPDTGFGPRASDHLGPLVYGTGLPCPLICFRRLLASLLVICKRVLTETDRLTNRDHCVMMEGVATPGSMWPRLCAELPALTRSAETAVVISAYGPLTRAPLRSSMAVGNGNREGDSASRTGSCGRASTVLATP